VLGELVQALQEGASFYVADNDHRVVLHRVEPKRSVRDSVHEGDRFALTSGASGHVLCAFNGGLGEPLDQVRRQMYAASAGERDPEIAALAAPVFGDGNRLIGAISVSGPRYRIEALGEEKILPPLLRSARELTNTLGGDADDPAFAGWLPASGAAVRRRRKK
jgi:DNA-binding IclR family transcriptional regulator